MKEEHLILVSLPEFGSVPCLMTYEDYQELLANRDLLD